MSVSTASLQKLMSLGLTTEQLSAVVEVLAVELAPLEARRSADRARKRNGNSADVPQNIRGSSAEIPQIARVEDNTNLPNLDLEKHTLSLSKPLPVNPRAAGTNPRALGTNPRAVAQEPEDFAAFMAVYPKRSGAVDRKQALKAFTPALKRANLETILHGAKAYNAEMTAKGKIGTEFVKQARTWLNADGWTEYQSSTPLAAVEHPSKVYVSYGTDAGDAWERYYRTVLKKVPPRDFKGGWWHPSEYPEQEAA